MYRALANGPNVAKLYQPVKDPKNESRIGYVKVISNIILIPCIKIMEYVQMEKHEELYPKFSSEDIKYYMYMILKVL